jgi:hypothetical protein
MCSAEVAVSAGKMHWKRMEVLTERRKEQEEATPKGVAAEAGIGENGTIRPTPTAK